MGHSAFAGLKASAAIARIALGSMMDDRGGWQYYQLVGSMVCLRILKAVLPAPLLLDLQDAGPAKYLNTWPADGTTRFIEGMCGFLKSTCVPKKQPTAGREHGPLTRDKVDDPVANATWHA